MERLHFESNTSISIIDILILLLVPLGLILSDWIIGIFSVGDFVFFSILLILLCTQNIFLEIIDYKILSLISVYLAVNFFLNLEFNNNFDSNNAIAATIKILYYSIFVLITYRFLSIKNLEMGLLKYLNMYSILVILIGLYISLAIYIGNLPFKFIWKLTRTDELSYFYNETIRMRSVFSEPAHLGFYLNLILSVNLFFKRKINFTKYINLLLFGGIILTFSYSSIAIMIVLILLYGANLLLKKGTFRFNKMAFVYMLLILLLVYISQDFLYKSLIERSFSIVNGEDGSASSRIFGSWEYVQQNNFLIGSGAGNTPPITNNFAYMISDLGIFAFVISILFSGFILQRNIGLGMLFIMLNFQKGGYLSPTLSVLIIFVMVYSKKEKTIESKRTAGHDFKYKS
ncbi:hypothetical protein ACEN4P_02255 [Marinilactibacillus psychrotolerans]|uniref:Uncharacterized protein n=1 Tax=Marinilactibacillus psychrotolerans TaxID=191770 RepID=A0ABW8UQL6_9LACT